MPVVGELVVNLKANTAQFSGDLGKAAGAAEEFGNKAEEAGRRTSFNMIEARGSVMLLGRAFGVQMPRALERLISTIPGVGVALVSILPIIGVVFAVNIIEKFIEKNHEAAEKFKQDWAEAGNTASTAMESMESKLRTAQIRADELSGQYLAALKLKLVEIDHQTLTGIIGEITKMGKATDAAFKDIETNWFVKFLMGDKGVGAAKSELDGMVAEVVKASHLGANASIITKLLGGDVDHVKSEMSGIWNDMEAQKKKLAETPKSNQVDDNAEYARAKQLLGTLQDQWNTKQKLLEQLQDMHDMSDTGTKAGEQEKKNSATEEGQDEASRQNAIYEAQQRGMSQRFDAEKRYFNEKKRLSEKAVKDAERMAEEESAATSAVNEELQRQQEEAAKLRDKIAQQNLEQTIEMSKLQEKAQEDAAKHLLAMHGASNKAIEQAEIDAVRKSAQTDIDGLNMREAALEKSDKMYLAKLQAFENEKKRVIQQGENQITSIQQKAQEQQEKSMEKWGQKFNSTFTSTLFQGKNFAQGMRQLGQQMLEDFIQQEMMKLERKTIFAAIEKLIDAHKAGANAMADVPYPANLAAAPQAVAMTLTMATGGEVPGVGSGDTVPAMLTPGETVVTKRLTEQVKGSTGNGGKGHTFYFAPTVHAVDAEGVDRMLTKHSATFTRHMKAVARKMGKR